MLGGTDEQGVPLTKGLNPGDLAYPTGSKGAVLLTLQSPHLTILASMPANAKYLLDMS